MSGASFRGGFQKPFSFPDFDRRVLKKRFRNIGKEVAKRSRKLVSRRAVSRAGELPGSSSGALASGIGYKPSRSGYSVGIASNYKWGKGNRWKKGKFSGKKPNVYYPAFVYYGHRGPGSDMSGGRSDNRQQHKKRVGRKVAAPRENWIVTAAEKYAHEKYQAELRSMLDEALKPGLIQEVINK